VSTRDYLNVSSQAERKAVLRNDRLTYHAQAQADIGTELGGRFMKIAKQNVVGASPIPYPKQPEGSPWASDPVGLEPPLGEDVNWQPPTGTLAEQQASAADTSPSTAAATGDAVAAVPPASTPTASPSFPVQAQGSSTEE